MKLSLLLQRKETLRASLEQLNQEIKVAASTENYISAQKTLTADATKLTRNVNESDFLAEIGNLARTSDVEILTLAPGPNKISEIFNIYPFQIVLLGSYAALTKFVDLLLENNYFFTLPNFNLKVDPNNQIFTEQILLTGTIVGYTLTNFDPKMIQYREPPKRSKKSFLSLRNPFLAQPTNSKKLNLQDQALLANLKFIGNINAAKKDLAIVSDGEGRIYQLTVGDHIGLHQSRILRISNAGIYTENAEDNLLLGN
ncbi:MAG: pilus assembly protein PilP [Gammaproteobacteria bacterium]|nr:pilus assembly protein PilP [Gammaproteobacteria bacterium]